MRISSKRIARLLCSVSFLMCLRAAGQLSGPQLLDVSAQQVGRESCMSYPGAYAAYFKVKATFTNNSTHPVILRKDALVVWTVKVANSLASVDHGKFVYAPNPSEASANPPMIATFGGQPDTTRFVVISPGVSFSTELWAEVLGGAGTKPTEAPTFGSDYVMQLDILAWPLEERSDPHALAKQWQPWGQLQIGDLQSAYFPVHMPSKADAKTADSCDTFLKTHSYLE